MKNSTIYILLGIFVMLLIAATQSYWYPYVPFKKDQRETVASNLIQNADNLTKITIKKKESELVLEKKDQAWSVNGMKAGAQRVSDLLLAIKNLETEALVSTNPDKFAQYEATTDSAIVMTFETPTGKEVLLVGDSSPQFGSFYLKPENEDKVFQVRSELRSLVQGSLEDWRDKILVNISYEQIARVEITQTGPMFNITKNDEGKWQAIQGSKQAILGDNLSDRLINAFDPLEASGFAKPEDKLFFTRTTKKSNLKIYKDAQQLALDLDLVKKEDFWLAQPKGETEIFTLQPALVTSFMLNPQDIFVN